MTRRGKASLVIGVFAGAAMTWSAATALIPVAGPLLADTAGLTAISIGMAYALAALYEKTIDTASLVAFGTVVLGAVFGNVAIKLFAGLIPIYGSFVKTPYLHSVANS